MGASSSSSSSSGGAKPTSPGSGGMLPPSFLPKKRKASVLGGDLKRDPDVGSEELVGPAMGPELGPQLPDRGASSSSSGVGAQEDHDQDDSAGGSGLLLDFFGQDGPVVPLAQQEVSALPPAPPKAKLEAVDLELDMFGNPVEADEE